MRKLFVYSSALIALSLAVFAVSQSSLAQNTHNWQVENPQLETALPKGAEAYAGIDGKHLWNLVEEQAKISRDYRDAGHPQFWGRIPSTSGDEADVQWLLGKYKQIGLSDARAQTINYFQPQWMAKSWSVTLNGKTLESAQPGWASPATGGKDLDLPVVYVGLGTEADFAGRDVKGKAVLVSKNGYSFPGAVMKRAEKAGAAAILGMDGERGGNHKAQSYRSYTNVPTFNIGNADGNAVRDAGPAARVTIKMDAEWISGQKSYLVWGTLPGATDETIYVIAHRDGWFEAAGDNASGVATMLGLAEHYAKIPQAQRKRTMIFIGTDGHHQLRPGWYGAAWLVANREKFFSKTALMINGEHPAEVLTHGDYAGTTTATIPNEWYAGGGSRPILEKISVDAFHEFGVPVWSTPSKTPPGGDLAPLAWFLPGVVAQSNDFNNMHTDADTSDTVSWSGLQNVTRAYARIIDEVNKLPLSALQAPLDPDPNAPGAPRQHLDLSHCQEWIADSTKGCAVSDVTLGRRGTAMEGQTEQQK